MPCRVELSDAEIRANEKAAKDRAIADALKPIQKRNDELTHENDQLREALLKIIEYYPKASTWIGEELHKKIYKDQVKHRREDLRRLEETFRDEMWKLIQQNGKSALTSNRMKALNLKIQAVQDADPTKPLEPQLGFDPDED